MNAKTTNGGGVSPKLKKVMFALTLGGVTGFLGAMAMMRLIDAGSLGDFGPSREIAALVGMLYVFTALATGFGVLSPKAGATFLNVEDAEELREQRAMLGLSSIGLAAFGLVLMVAAFAGPVGPIPPVTVLFAIGVLMIGAAIASIASWRRQDELMHAVGREAGTMAFYLLLLVGGGWALLAHLELATGPAALDWLTMIWALLLVASFIVIGRRGMLRMR